MQHLDRKTGIGSLHCNLMYSLLEGHNGGIVQMIGAL